MQGSRCVSKSEGRRIGFTLVELLVALLIFAIVAVLAGTGIVQSLRLQQSSEAGTALQGKLRRVTEVIGQDVRSILLGGLASYPFASGATSISFSLADGGQGFQVATNEFANTDRKQFFANAASAGALGIATGNRVLMTNAAGAGIVYRVTNPAVASVGGAGSHRWRLRHATCGSAIAYQSPMHMFVVESVGYAFDAATGTLSRQVANQASQPVAFNLSGFRIEYAYRGTDGTLRYEDAALATGGAVARVAVIGGVDYTLESLRVTVAAEEALSGGNTTTREYVSQIAMPPTGTVNLRTVVSCI